MNGPQKKIAIFYSFIATLISAFFVASCGKPIAEKNI